MKEITSLGKYDGICELTATKTLSIKENVTACINLKEVVKFVVEASKLSLFNLKVVRGAYLRR